MKIIISPSKTQNILNNCLSYNEPKYLSESLKLFNYLKTLSQEDLAKAMHIKGKTLDQTFKLYQSFDSFVSPKQSAIHLYTGVVYEGLNLSSYSKDQILFLNEHVRILSAMYGVLKPSDCVYPYRLDFTMKFEDLKLKDIWKDRVIEEFKNEDVILDLASQEFSQLLDPIKDKLHKVEFVDIVNGKEKIVSYHAKRMRGIILDFVIQAQSIKHINTFNQEYQYDHQASHSKLSKFIRKT